MDYYVVSQGKTTIPNVDDGEEFQLTDVRNTNIWEFVPCDPPLFWNREAPTFYFRSTWRTEIVYSSIYKLFFFFLFTTFGPICIDLCILSNNIMDYYVVSQGKTTIPGVDDGEEFQMTDVRRCASLILAKITLYWCIFYKWMSTSLIQ